MSNARHERILNLVDLEGSVEVAALAEEFSVSEMTVRRDLNALVKAGLVRRTHGGATRSFGRAYETPYRVREGQHSATKALIAKKALSFIATGDAIGLDVGSTVLAVTRYLDQFSRLTVVTPSLRAVEQIASRVSTDAGFRVVVAGGVLRLEEQSMTGPHTVDTFRSLRLDTSFIGVAGFDMKSGATEHNLDDAEVKRAIIGASKQVVLLADSSKLGQVAFAEVAPADKIDALITDDGAEPTVLDEIRAGGIDVHVVSTQGKEELPN